MSKSSKIERFCWKTGEGSFSGSCPTMYDATDGGWVVQGKIIPDRSGTLWVDADVIDRRGLDVTVLGFIEAAPQGGYYVTGELVDEATLTTCRDLADDEHAVHVKARELALV
jgi:hypothetical protein